MASNFLPPEDYQDRDLSTKKIKAGETFYRCYDTQRPIEQAMFFGTTLGNRYDDPEQKVGVCYIGTSLTAAIVETILHSRSGINAVSENELRLKALAEITFTHDIELVWFSGTNLKKNQTTANIYTCPHPESQQWAGKIMQNPRNYAGILFPCSHNDQARSVSLFEGRAQISEVVSAGTLDEIDETYEILLSHGVGTY